MFGFIQGLVGLFRHRKEGALSCRLTDYARAISAMTIFEDGLADEVIAAVREKREIRADTKAEAEWNAERQFFLVTMMIKVCIREGIDDAGMIYAVSASVLDEALGMPDDHIPDFMRACWVQIGVFERAGDEPPSAKDASLRFAYESGLAAAENFLALAPDDTVMPATDDVENFVAMGPRAAERSAFA